MQTPRELHALGVLRRLRICLDSIIFDSSVIPAHQWSYYSSIMRLASEGPGRATHRPRRAGETSFGGDIVPRATTGWPPGNGGARHMTGGLFRKVMTFIGSGAKADSRGRVRHYLPISI
jgi:hypothetical protein